MSRVVDAHLLCLSSAFLLGVVGTRGDATCSTKTMCSQSVRYQEHTTSLTPGRTWNPGASLGGVVEE